MYTSTAPLELLSVGHGGQQIAKKEVEASKHNTVEKMLKPGRQHNTQHIRG